jgi:hypothetical protein
MLRWYGGRRTERRRREGEGERGVRVTEGME